MPATLVTTLAIPTCNRIDLLSRALSSYLENIASFGRTCDVLIVDDSLRAEVRERVRSVLGEFKSRFNVRIFYAGREEKILFAKRLIQLMSAPAETVKFALFDTGSYSMGTYGANHNAILLHAVGQALVMVDDDTICRIVEAPARTDDFCVFPEAPHSSCFPCGVWVYPSREDLLADMRFVEKDYLSMHEHLLGREAADCMPADACASSRRALTGARVLATFNGVAGDCAWNSPSGYLLLDPDSTCRLIQSNAHYLAASVSREMLRVVTRRGIARTCANSPGLFTGLDNRDVLPPYIPVGRGEDIIYWNTLSAVRRDGVFGFLPWALLHQPAEKRRFWRGEILRSSAGVALDLLISSLVRSYASASADANENLIGLGKHLVELGSQPAVEFSHVANELIGKDADGFVRYLESIESRHPQGPPAWREDIRNFLSTARKAFSRPERIIPLDLLYSRTEEQALEACRRLIVQFGNLLLHWPQIMRAARDLRSEGLCLGAEILN